MKDDLYFGVFHSLHTCFSDCGECTLEEFYEFMQNRVDFTSLTDHDYADLSTPAPRESYLSDEDWATQKSFVQEHNKPGRFVMFLGFEWTSPGDHKHIAFYDYPDLPRWHGIPRNPTCYRTPQELFSYLAEHSGVANHSYSLGRSWKDGSQTDAHGVCPNIEMWCGHRFGWCQWAADYDVCVFPKMAELDPYGFVRDVLERGYHLGFVGNWDDGHRFREVTRRGVNGLTGVYAKNLTKKEILDATKKRHNYATSGVRIELSVTDDEGHMMGDIFKTSNSNPTFKVEMKGTDKLLRARLFKDGRICCTKMLTGMFTEFSYTDDEGISDGNEHYFFVEIQQKGDGNDPFYNEFWGGPHYEYAWSSPMYITFTETR